MRKVLFIALLGLSVPAFADSYDVIFGWTDPTTYLPDEVPTFEARYRIADGQVTVIPGGLPAERMGNAGANMAGAAGRRMG